MLAPLTDIQYVQAVRYQDMFQLDILTLEGGTSECNYRLMLCTIPEDSRSKNLFNYSVPFHQQNAKCWNIYVMNVTLVLLVSNLYVIAFKICVFY